MRPYSRTGYIRYCIYLAMSGKNPPPFSICISTHLVTIKPTLKIQDVLHVFGAALTLVNFLGHLSRNMRIGQQRQ